jgi:hypothetical protein
MSAVSACRRFCQSANFAVASEMYLERSTHGKPKNRLDGPLGQTQSVILRVLAKFIGQRMLRWSPIATVAASSCPRQRLRPSASAPPVQQSPAPSRCWSRRRPAHRCHRSSLQRVSHEGSRTSHNDFFFPHVFLHQAGGTGRWQLSVIARAQVAGVFASSCDFEGISLRWRSYTRDPHRCLGVRGHQIGSSWFYSAFQTGNAPRQHMEGVLL